ncbi:UDP-3-O-[3-hydroxymyristoyl] N-acetylglucosamine deacetylase [Candidatus Dependentiae bacterium]|nr:UDP-3-O-[3-hydroxymyristoyl] N-acetylglucosamine deacetylase [Candidatus Dependentiae bacterium]
MNKQQTLRGEIFFQGLGVHTGAPCSITLKPADAKSGISFINEQNPDQIIRVGSVIPDPAMHATVIRTNQWALSTVEHLMAALMLMGIDNVDILVSGTEIPILDGSALLFVQGIVDIGVLEQDASKQWITPRERLEFADDKGRSMFIEPAVLDQHQDERGFKPALFIDYNADFIHPLNGNPVLTGQVTQDFFMHEIAPARTFGFLEQLPFLRHHKLAQGTSLGNSLVIGNGELLNEMRLPDECVRHKFLDLIGDLSLLGKNLIGSVKANKTSHNFNRLVIEHFLKNPEKWLVIE